MRSLALKLTLAFLLVGLTGAVIVALLVRLRTRQEFDRLVVDQYQQALVTILTRYYRQNRSWVGVEQVFHPRQENNNGSLAPEPPWEARKELFAIADSEGHLVFSDLNVNLGSQVSRHNLEAGIPLEEGGQTVGWLLFTPRLDRWRPGTPEGDFLFGVNNAILISALLATTIALLLGGVLAYTLTRSLRELTAATQVLAEGKLGHQVQVRSQDELGVLAESFNQMSTALAHSNDLRRKMTADIAHDLRTPLSVILGYTEALHEDKLAPTPEIFAVMHTESLHLSRLIEDLKTLSLADAGELPLSRQLVPLGDLLKRVADAHRVKADNKKVAIHLEVAPDLPEINVDVERMVQVLGNLISNALRHTPAGGQISMAAVSSPGRVELSVVDTGEGIPASDLPFIFERSYRGDKARHAPEGESGLGLAIARSLVETHGGKIMVNSAVGKGTTFTIYLPVQTGDAAG